MKLCVNTRPVYLVRCVNPRFTGEFASLFDGRIDAALARLVNLPDNTELSELSKSVRTLSATNGGLGMRSLTRIRELAYYASWLTSMRYIRENFPTIYGMRNHIQFHKRALEALELTNFPKR